MAVDLKGAPNREGFYFGPLKCSKICFSHYCIGMKKYLNQCKAERCPRRLGACQPDVSQAPRRTRLHGRSIRNSILIGQRLQFNAPAQFRDGPDDLGLFPILNLGLGKCLLERRFGKYQRNATALEMENSSACGHGGSRAEISFIHPHTRITTHNAGRIHATYLPAG